DQHGFYDKDLRMLWLTLSLVTNSYQPEKNMDFYDELSGYTASIYDYSIRQNAFGYLYQIDVFSERNYKDLIKASLHPVWQFRNFSRSLLKTLTESEDHRNKLETLLPRLPDEQQNYLEKLLKETTD